MKNHGNGILFIPTNGVGLGHLTRTLAIARRIKSRNPEEEIYIFTTCPALHLIEKENMVGYHYPSLEIVKDKMSPKYWNKQLSMKLVSIIQKHNPRLIVFDGAYPYEGVVSALRKVKLIKKVWIRKNVDENSPYYRNIKLKEKYFSTIIIPGEINEVLNDTSKIKYFADPIIYLNQNEILSKEESRTRLSIPEKNKVVYIQLGAGTINDISSPINQLLDVLSRFQNLSIVVGQSPIGNKISLPSLDNLQVIRTFPNSIYFKGFDLIISATGYNTFYEILFFHIPSLLIPNQQTKSDNQLKRALIAQEAKAAIITQDLSAQHLEHCIHSLLTHPSIYIENAKKLNINNGADEIAQFLLSLKSS